MTLKNLIKQHVRSPCLQWCVLALGLALSAAVYWPGLSGGFTFDDNPNIVDNKGVQPEHASIASLVGAALSSPSSDFKRPLASLSFAANYLVTGLDPYWMKLTNLAIHLLNGLLVFLLARKLLVYEHPLESKTRQNLVPALIATSWMLLPINLTAVLYVVQRMESMANLMVLLGLIGYMTGREHMLAAGDSDADDRANNVKPHGWKGFLICVVSLTVPTAIGSLAKETAVMLPLYALLIEWALFDFKRPNTNLASSAETDRRIVALFSVVLITPFIVGAIWLLQSLLRPEIWAGRNFTLYTRLLSEARIVMDYIAWTLLPTPNELSFYHDNFKVSSGLFTPLTTLISIIALVGLIWAAFWLRSRRPLVALGIAFFLACQVLTGTVLPLELIYEHRNYFASFGLMLVVVPLLTPSLGDGTSTHSRFALARSTLLGALLLLWSGETALTAIAWGNPLMLAETLAYRAPDSPRALYELGRNYIIYSNYNPASPFVQMAYAPLEQAAALPDSSILPEQALIFMNSRMRLPLKNKWWNSMIVKLKSKKPGVQDESSLGALTQCARDHQCDLPQSRMVQAYLAALSHPNPSARLLAMYSDYAWNVLEDRQLGIRLITSAIEAAPSEAAYRITVARMYIAQGRKAQATQVIGALEKLNIGGSLNNNISELKHDTQ